MSIVYWAVGTLLAGILLAVILVMQFAMEV